MASIESTMSSTGQSAVSDRHAHIYGGGRKPLTIHMPTKIVRESKKNKSYVQRPSISTVAIKWVCSLVFCVVLLACAIISKLSVLSLSSRMKYESSKDEDKKDKEKNVDLVLFVMLFWIALVPNVVNFLRAIWIGAFRKDIPWPSKPAFIWGAVISAAESFGMCLFVFYIPGLQKDMQPCHVVLLMSCVHLIPILGNIVKAYRQQERRARWISFAQNLVALLLLLAGLTITLYLMIREANTGQWSLPVAVVCLSFAWTPYFQTKLLKTSIQKDDQSKQSKQTQPEVDGDSEASHLISDQRRHSSYQSTSDSAYTDTFASRSRSEGINTSINMTDEAAESITGPGGAHPTEPVTWKLTLYMSFLKIICTLVFSPIFFKILFEKQSPFDFFKEEGWEKWDEGIENDGVGNVLYFVLNTTSSFVGYVVAYIACTTCMQTISFALPLLLVTPVTLMILMVKTSCDIFISNNERFVCVEDVSQGDLALIISAAVCLVISQLISLGWYLFKTDNLVMQKEDQLFWLPMYNSALLDQWLMLARKNTFNDDTHIDPKERAKRSKIIICTTMYREEEHEMRQLLESIQSVNKAQCNGGRHFEAHIFFDDAVKESNPTKFVLQLVSLVNDTLELSLQQTTKVKTPYGMSLQWQMNNYGNGSGMVLTIHLKDNRKVKNKKRWSQVMYMSYVLDFLKEQMDDATLDETYILTTDADVRFTPDSVEALLDLMTRDHSVGATCARTYPLGNGPLVWYQMFEYAIGHWFQKAAEHVIGSVLCSPGCFSVYRCKALKDILPEYATNVEHAFDFLTKDMGEDRWLCTLMVQSGWRIEYCAASENSTHCPEDFDEFFKQRRRWVASTLANMMLLLREWATVSKLNHRVSWVFYVYQMLLLAATLIGPSSVILVVSGGLFYAWNVSSLAAGLIQLIVCIGYTLVCLLTRSEIQLAVAKFLTFLYAITMTVVIVGTAVQIATDFTNPEPPKDVNGTTTARPSNISVGIQISTTTAYLIALAGIFIATAIFHLRECVYLIHGIWYLLFLPSGYVILMLYSICNITDRTWGTREMKTSSVVSSYGPWYKNLDRIFQRVIKTVFFCCFNAPVPSLDMEVQTDAHVSVRHGSDADIWETADARNKNITSEQQLPNILEAYDQPDYGRQSPIDSADGEDYDEDRPVPVEDWLPIDLKRYVTNFVANGFEDTRLISGMTERELKDIGIKRKGVKKYFMELIKQLPDFDIEADVPDTVHEWLEKIGLSMYKKSFDSEQIKTSNDMEILKSFGRSEIETELKITKTGHIKRLLKAIRELRNPTDTERKIIAVRKALDNVQKHNLKVINREEYDFWEQLRKSCLLPQSTAFGHEQDLKRNLGDLRNKWLMIFAISNTLWLVLISTLADKGKLLAVFGSNPVGLGVLLLFSLVLLFQFLAMLVHRLATLIHFLGRAPYRYGDSFNSSWTFDNLELTDDDITAIEQKRWTNIRAQEKIKRGPRKPKNIEDKQALLEEPQEIV